ncbi:MAG: hypothetical protein OEQ25_03420 [Gammaproteobacteria bacterium]|nr:hypothetical protein [Gammaproteobacteria bacterium]MDH3506167.1 hypothetical protein [Gammaproteobacteria bacterium]
MTVRASRAIYLVLHALSALTLAGLLGACATGSRSTTLAGTLVEPVVLTPEQQAIVDRREAREETLLQQVLTPDTAAELALLHNPVVAGALETLDMLYVDRLLVAHTVNPDFNGGRPPSTMDTRIERPISVNVMSWLYGPALDTSFTPEERLARVQAADEVGALLFAARRAWVSAVSARQTLRYFEDVVLALEGGRDIVESMRSVGNASELEALRAQTLHADAIAHLTTVQVAAAVERERLIQVLGLWGPDAERVQVPERFPDLPRTPVTPDGIEGRAVAQRFDVEAGRSSGSPGEAAVNARADVRTAWLAYRGAYDLARHAREALVPLAERTSAEQLKMYNGMLIGVLDLVADAAQRINAVNAALDAERDFWLAEIELQRAMAGVGISAVAPQPGAPTGFQPGASYHVH